MVLFRCPNVRIITARKVILCADEVAKTEFNNYEKGRLNLRAFRRDFTLTGNPRAKPWQTPNVGTPLLSKFATYLPLRLL